MPSSHRRSRPPRLRRATALLLLSLLASLALTSACAGLPWTLRGSLFRGPTPTPTSTPFAPPTATPDFRATRTAEDILTQVAYSTQLAERGLEPPTPAGSSDAPTAVVVNVPVVIQPDATATALAVALLDAAAATAQAGGQPIEPQPLPGEATSSINLPVVTQPEEATPTPLPPTPTFTPIPVIFPDTPTPVPPTPTPLPEVPTPTLVVPTLPPATPTFTPAPTIPFVVNSMAALIVRQNGIVRVGPSSLYTQTGTIALGTQVTLLARDGTGEWLFVCCAPNTNTPGWMRGVSAQPTLNPTLPPPLATSDPNDVRWLSVRGPDSNLAPIPASTPIPPADYPMARHDRGNSGRVAALPRLPLAVGWQPGTNAGLAGGPFTSGAIVVGNSVLAASSDGHLYCFERDTGSQRWRFFLGEPVRATPLADSGLIFVITESGRLVALEDQGLQAVQRWSQGLALQPRGMVASSGRIALTGRGADAERLLIVDRGNGAVLRNINLGGAPSQLPAVGGQTVFVASDLVRAYDIFSGDLIWQSTEATSFTAPPLFSSPGAKALAELYAADASGRLISIDANTGAVLWIASVGAAPSGLAANGAAVFATGPGFVRAFARAVRPEGQLLWNVGVAGTPVGGAIVDDSRVFVGTDGGAFQYLDVVTGALLQGNVQSPVLGGATAVGGPWIFAPGQSGTLFAAREVQ